MKMRILVCLFVWIPYFLAAQGITFVAQTPPQAIEAAKMSHKFVFIDFGATWCRPCQMLEKGTFLDDSLGRFFNKHFISIHIDADKQAEWVKYYHVPTYPHLLILNQEGQELWSYTSYVDAVFLLRNAKTAIQFHEEKYNFEKNPKNVLLLQKYIETIPKHSDYKDSTLHIVQHFLAQFPQKEWLVSPQWELVKTYITDIQNPEYQYLLTHTNEFPAHKEKLKNYLYQQLAAYKDAILKKPNTADWEKYKACYIAALQQFNELLFPQNYYLLQADMAFFAAKRDEENYLSTAKQFLVAYSKANDYAKIAMEIVQNFRPISPLWTNAEEWAKKSVDIDAFSSYPNYVYGYVKMRKNDLTNALKFAEKAKMLALDANEQQQAEDLIVKIKQKMK